MVTVLLPRLLMLTSPTSVNVTTSSSSSSVAVAVSVARVPIVALIRVGLVTRGILFAGRKEGNVLFNERERNVLFNDALN